jgi:hypothetical protein
VYTVNNIELAKNENEENIIGEIEKQRTIKICNICMSGQQSIQLECGSDIPHFICKDCFGSLKAKGVKNCPFDRNIVINL